MKKDLTCGRKIMMFVCSQKRNSVCHTALGVIKTSATQGD